MLLAVSSPDGFRSELEIRSIAEFELRTKLLGVLGIALVTVMGRELPEYQVKEISELAHTMNQMASKLDSLENLRREFVANVSHDHLDCDILRCHVWLKTCSFWLCFVQPVQLSQLFV